MILKKEVREELKENILYLWHGSLFTNKNTHPRMDKTYLYTLFQKDNDIWIQRLLSYKNIQNPENPYVRFSLDPLYRILEGPKTGWCLPIEYIQDDFKKCPAYITKKVIRGTKREELNEHKSLDEFLLELLSKQKLEERIYKDTIQAPNIYLVSKHTSKDVYIRNSVDVVEDTYEEFVTEHTLEDKHQANEKYFDYKYFHGRGVLVSDPSDFLQWYSIPKDRAYLERDDLVVSLLKPIRKY